MSFKRLFLQLEISSQIKYTVRGLTFLIFVLTLTIFGSSCYEILKQSYRQQKQYFNDMERSITENKILFQSLQLLYYEDITKTSIHEMLSFLANINSTFNETLEKSDISFISEYLKNSEDNTTNDCKDKICLFYFFLTDDRKFETNTDDFTLRLKKSIVKMIPLIEIEMKKTFSFLNKKRFIFRYFSIYLKEYEVLISTNKTTKVDQGSNPYGLKEMELALKDYISNLTSEDNLLYDYIFSDLDMGLNSNKMEDIKDFNLIIFHQPILSYDTNIVYNADKVDNYRYIATGVFNEDFFEEFFERIIEAFRDFTSIPTIYSEKLNHNIIKANSPCQFLLELQLEYMKNIEKETVALKPEENIITNCFIDSKTKREIDLFLFNYTISLPETRYMVLNFYQMKYLSLHTIKNKFDNYLVYQHHFPDSVALSIFKPGYFPIQEFTVYSFQSHIITKKRTQQIEFLLHNIFLLIILVVFFIWFIWRYLLIYLTYQLTKEVTEPIINLRTSVEAMTFTDNNIFTYKDDDIINEMFGTCKDLLRGALIVTQKQEKDIKETNLNNIIINQEVIAQASTEENILRFNCNKIGFPEFSNSISNIFEFDKKRTQSEENIFCSNNNIIGNINRTFENTTQELLSIAKEIFDSKTYNLNIIKDKEGNIIKNKKNILYSWYMENKMKKRGFLKYSTLGIDERTKLTKQKTLETLKNHETQKTLDEYFIKKTSTEHLKYSGIK